MSYGIQLVHQNPALKRYDARAPLWWHGPLKQDVRGQEWERYLPPIEAHFATVEDAQRRVAQMAPFATTRIAPLSSST